MFGFRNRKQYNGTVDEKLTSGYGIATRDNPRFPGVLAYLGLIDQAWENKFTEEEAAMFVATLYYSGLRREGHREGPRSGSQAVCDRSSGLRCGEDWDAAPRRIHGCD